MPFPGDWLGPRGTGAVRAAGADDEAGRTLAQGADAPVGDQPDRKSPSTQTHASPARPGVVAERLLGGLADAGDLIQFPAEPAVAAAAGSRVAAPATSSPSGGRGRRRLRRGDRSATLGWAGRRIGQRRRRLVAGRNLPADETRVDQPQMGVGGADVDATAPSRRPSRYSYDSSDVAGRFVRHADTSSGRSQPVVYSPPSTQPTAPRSSGSGGGVGGGGGAGVAGWRPEPRKCRSKRRTERTGCGVRPGEDRRMRACHIFVVVCVLAGCGAMPAIASADETVLVCDVYGNHVAPRPSGVPGIATSARCPGNAAPPKYTRLHPPGGLAIWTLGNRTVPRGRGVECVDSEEHAR